MTDKGANLGFEQKMWRAADKPRSNMDAAEMFRVSEDVNNCRIGFFF